MILKNNQKKNANLLKMKKEEILHKHFKINYNIRKILRGFKPKIFSVQIPLLPKIIFKFIKKVVLLLDKLH